MVWINQSIGYRPVDLVDLQQKERSVGFNNHEKLLSLYTYVDLADASSLPHLLVDTLVYEFAVVLAVLFDHPGDHIFALGVVHAHAMLK